MTSISISLFQGVTLFTSLSIVTTLSSSFHNTSIVVQHLSSLSNVNESNSIFDYNSHSPLDSAHFEPTWESLDSRVLPEWYDKAKVGIFIHWGVFSVPAFGSEWFWYNWKTYDPNTVKYIRDNYPPKWTYQDFARDFKAEFFDPSEWAALFEKAGAKYVVLTSKHHEGYTMWPSKYSFAWNSMDVGPKRDLVGDLADAIRTKTQMRFGVYHSLLEWFNPLCVADRWDIFSTDYFVRFKAMPELYELVNKYKPDVIWSDGDWDALETYWKSKEFLAWLYNSSPVKDTVVTNDRWGYGVPCKHGGFFTCKDRYNPGVVQPFKWENAMTLDKASWGFRRNAKLEDFLSAEEVISEVVTTVSCGGNILINIGPTKEGTIVPIMQERLLQLGSWLEINGEAIYESTPWSVTQNDSVAPNVWYTTQQSSNRVLKVFAIIISKWPGPEIILGSVNHSIVKDLNLLGCPSCDTLKFSPYGEGIKVELPDMSQAIGKWAWTISIKL